MDMGTNTSDIEVRPQRDGIRAMDGGAQASRLLVNVILPTTVSEQISMPHIILSISGYDPEMLRGSHLRSHDTGV